MILPAHLRIKLGLILLAVSTVTWTLGLPHTGSGRVLFP